MNQRDLRIFLILQILAIAVAGTAFSQLSSKIVAGAIAGSFFVGSGLFMFKRLWRWSDKWRSFTLYPLFIHVFLISIPMVTVRFSQIQSNFEDIKIWGLEGPIFHRLSSNIFMLLVAATIIDLIRSYLVDRKRLG
jgi:hypothetical protein